MEEKIFTKLQIGSMELKNRVVLPAMGTKFVDGRSVSQKLIDYHVNRVKGGCGLNIVEVASVHDASAPEKFLSISRDEYLPGLTKLCDAIHENGGKVGIQLWQGSLAVARDPNARILVPSDMHMKSGEIIKGMSYDDIMDVVSAYGKAAYRAYQAGFDCVEIHMGHNYLMHSFLSGAINHRDDEFGGSFENRCRLPLMVIDAVVDALPDDFPVFVRIDAHDDYLENGLTIGEVINFLKIAKEHGIKVADISRGNIISSGMKYEVPPIDIAHGFNIENAHQIKEETGLIVMGVGRINKPELAIQIIQDNLVDLVGIGRAQLADPEFVNKMKAKEYDKINYCVGCNQGCYDGFENLASKQITCLRNPCLGTIDELNIKLSNNPKKVLIAGGGIAGMMAAMIADLRGHEVILVEASDHLGGQFKIAGVAPRKGEMQDAMVTMANQINAMDIQVLLKTKVDDKLIEQIKPDVIINAIGAKSLIPPFEGVDRKEVYNAHDVLTNQIKLDGKVVVIGGGMVGMEIAEYEHDTADSVTVVEMNDEVCKDLGTTRKITVLEAINQSGIQIATGVKVEAILDHDVQGKKGDDEVFFDYDHVVIAIGARSNDDTDLANAAKKLNLAYYKIGDANKARRAIDATREAYEVAMKI